MPIFGGRSAPTPPPDPSSFEFPEWDLPDWDLSFLGFLRWLPYVMLGLVLAALVAGLVYLLFRMRVVVPDAPASGRTNDGGDATAPADPLLALPTLSHEELARLGRYREAVHALLVAALLRTGWSPEGRGRGLTAREIVRAYERPEPVRAPLVELLRLVERIWFGGRDATEDTYRTALALHRAFTSSGTSAATTEQPA